MFKPRNRQELSNFTQTWHRSRRLVFNKPKFPRYFVEAVIFSALDNAPPKFPRYFVEAVIFSALDNEPP
jgi:hypothetical protein